MIHKIYICRYKKTNLNYSIAIAMANIQLSFTKTNLYIEVTLCYLH